MVLFAYPELTYGAVRVLAAAVWIVVPQMEEKFVGNGEGGSVPEATERLTVLIETLGEKDERTEASVTVDVPGSNSVLHVVMLKNSLGATVRAIEDVKVQLALVAVAFPRNERLVECRPSNEVELLGGRNVVIPNVTVSDADQGGSVLNEGS
ncbi:hypothetical protein BGZ63DRAFT_377877 [Mariannaea sp. PMI_226]|nr:hypothetical protein BGZ63DRAFT_377877 [Mariannaea sp. PMI_226]